jgi:predicted acylesterase/phospholipase RssA
MKVHAQLRDISILLSDLWTAFSGFNRFRNLRLGLGHWRWRRGQSSDGLGDNFWGHLQDLTTDRLSIGDEEVIGTITPVESNITSQPSDLFDDAELTQVLGIATSNLHPCWWALGFFFIPLWGTLKLFFHFNV